MLVSAANNTLDQAQKISEKIRRNIFFGLTEQDNTAEDLDTLYQLTTLSLDQLDYLAREFPEDWHAKLNSTSPPLNGCNISF